MSKRALHVAPTLKLPAQEAQTQTIVVYGGKGMGKTNFGSVFVEELDRAGLRFSWIDPVGVAWGLKHSSDGRGQGIKVLILGGSHGDLPIEPTAGAVVADLVVDEEVSVIIDISRKASGEMWTQGEKIRFVRDYCTRLFQRQGERRRPLTQVIDEAGRFVPQQVPKGAVDIAACMGAIEQLVELGRNVGVGALLITQRSARMNKSVSELAEMMIAFRTVGPRSIDAIVDWFAEHKSIVRAELETQLRSLPLGTALVVSPGWLGVEGQYAMRARETFDSSDTPTAGSERRPRGKGAAIDRAKYLARMADTIEKAKAEDPRELRRQVAELQRELQKRPVEKEVERVEVPVEIPVIRAEDVEQLERILAPAVNGMGAVLKDAQLLLGEIRDRAGAALPGRVTGKPEEAKPAGTRGSIVKSRMQGRGEPAVTGRGAGSRTFTPPSKPDRSRPESADDVHLRRGERRMLETLARHHAVKMTRAQLGTLAGFTPSGGTFGTYFGTLKRHDLIAESAGLVEMTGAGFDYLGEAPAAPMTTDEVVAMWRGAVRAGERRMLDELVAAYPDWLSREELGERSGFTISGGTFGTYLGTLRRNGLAEVEGDQVRAGDALFLAGAVA